MEGGPKSHMSILSPLHMSSKEVSRALPPPTSSGFQISYASPQHQPCHTTSGALARKQSVTLSNGIGLVLDRHTNDI